MPRYDFQCESEACGKIVELSIKLADYENTIKTLKCEICGCKMKRLMDFKGSFELKGAGWYGVEGTGTGYGITQTEMDRNGEINKFEDEKVGLR